MTTQKEVTFALLILAAQHMSQSMAAWIGCGIVIAAILLSDTVGNARRRLWWHLTRR